MVSRGEIWLANIGSSDAQEPAGARPCVIVSPPEIHDHLGIVIVAPVTQQARPAGFRIPASVEKHPGVVRLELLRAVSKRQLVRQVDALDNKSLSAALAALREMFAE